MTADKIKHFIGDLARPFSIISTSTAASVAIVIGALRIEGGAAGAAYIGAVLAGLVGLYGFKAWEQRPQRRATDQAEG